MPSLAVRKSGQTGHPLWLALISFCLTACTTVPISKVELDKLKLEVRWIETETKTLVDVEMRRGFFDQPVRTDDNQPIFISTATDDIPLQANREKGRYGLRSSDLAAPAQLLINGIGEVTIPAMLPVQFVANNSDDIPTYLPSDKLVLDLGSTQADERRVRFIAQCGGIPTSIERTVTRESRIVEFDVQDLVRSINQKAEASLKGRLPVMVIIEERYLPDWPQPFTVGVLAAQAQTDAVFDTSGGPAVQFKITTAISNNVRLSYQNQPWPVRYCF